MLVVVVSFIICWRWSKEQKKRGEKEMNRKMSMENTQPAEGVTDHGIRE